MKRPLEYALWCDCETDDERAVFLHSGRAIETGVVAPILAPELAEVFMDRASLRAEVERLRVRSESIEDLSLRRIAALKETEAMVVPKEDREIRDLSWLLDDIKGAIEKLQVDAKLGRMVRAMPPRSRLCRGIPEEGDRRDWYCFWGNDDRAASEGDTPEEALAAAGVKG